MNTYRVTVFTPEPVCWEGEAVNCTDALILGRAHADPASWKTYVDRPNVSNTAPPWPLFRRPTQDGFGFNPIECRVERIR